MAFGSKNSTPSFVLTLPMAIGLNEQDYLNALNPVFSFSRCFFHKLTVIFLFDFES